MNRYSTLTNYISEYQFNETISDEELISITNVFVNMKVKISKRVLQSILSYSKVLEVQGSDRLKSQMILN
jgi:hypothetical protein